MWKSSGKLYFPVCSHKLTLFLCSAADRQAERQTGDAVPTALGGGQRLTRRRFLCGLPLLRPQRDQAAPHLNRFAPPPPPGEPHHLEQTRTRRSSLKVQTFQTFPWKNQSRVSQLRLFLQTSPVTQKGFSDKHIQTFPLRVRVMDRLERLQCLRLEWILALCLLA